MKRLLWTLAAGLLAAALVPVSQGLAQAPRGGPRTPPQQWWGYKEPGGVFLAPTKAYIKLSDLLAAHAGQNNWSQLVINNAQQQATYNSAAPGSKFGGRMNVDTNAMFAVVRGEIHFTVEGQPPVTATRGSVVNILNSTIHSWEIAGNQNALWVEIHPTDTHTVYPASEPSPPPVAGMQVVKLAFGHNPGKYTEPNQLHWNLFEAVAACTPIGVHVDEPGLYASALGGYADGNDPTAACKGKGGYGVQAPNALTPNFDANATFGHLHGGKMEWWLIQSGIVVGRIEKAGEFHAHEGDIMAAPQGTWHTMNLEGPGFSERLGIVPFSFNNEQNTAGGD